MPKEGKHGVPKIENLCSSYGVYSLVEDAGHPPPTGVRFENGSMLRRLGLAISYFIAIVYFFSILLPSVYCLRHGCRGPAELDAFMPAFMFTPVGAIATAFSLHNSVQQIRKGQSSSWVFWPLAIVFAMVVLGVIAFIALMIFEAAIHR